MRARIWIAAVLALLLSGSAVVSFTPPAQAEDSWIEWQMLGYVNRSRAGAGLPPLSMSRDVQGIARGWSDYLAATDSLWHNPNAWGQIASVAPSWTAMGENVGWGWNTADIHNALMASSVHRNQILGSYNNVGIGVTVRNGKIYVTEDFVRTSGSLSAASAPNFSVASDGDLVRNPVGGAVYLVEGGAKFWFRDAASFWDAGYNWSSVRDLSPTVLDAMPSTPRPGTLLAQRGDFRVFVVQAGAKFWIPNSYEFGAMGYDPNAVAIVPAGSLVQISDVPRDGSLLTQRGDPRIFVIRGGKKAWIPSPEAFVRAGYSWSSVITVPPGSLSALPEVRF